MKNDFYTVKEFADKFGCSPDRVYEWLRAGEIKHYERLTKQAIYRIPKKELARLKGEEGLASKESVVQHAIRKEADPSIVIQRREHFVELASVAKSLLINGLEDVSYPGWSTNRSLLGEYLIPNKDAASGYDGITKEQLASHLNSNMAAIVKDRDWFFRDCFVPHLKSELPEELKTKLFYRIIEEQPYQLIEVLRILAAKKTFKGTCPACP